MGGNVLRQIQILSSSSVKETHSFKLCQNTNTLPLCSIINLFSGTCLIILSPPIYRQHPSHTLEGVSKRLSEWKQVNEFCVCQWLKKRVSRLRKRLGVKFVSVWGSVSTSRQCSSCEWACELLMRREWVGVMCEWMCVCVDVGAGERWSSCWGIGLS